MIVSKMKFYSKEARLEEIMERLDQFDGITFLRLINLLILADIPYLLAELQTVQKENAELHAKLETKYREDETSV